MIKKRTRAVLALDKKAKAEKVHQVFQTINDNYDRMNDIISLRQHRKWKKVMIDKICAAENKKILDVCCGTGDISLWLAARMPEAQVTGLDFADKMLRTAKRRQKEQGLKNISFRLGNAMQMPFADNSFDCAVISFGLRNVPDYLQTVKEMRRVVRPGGAVYCLDSSSPSSFWVKPFFRLYSDLFIPLAGRLVAHHKSEYQWFIDSTAAFLSKEELKKLFGEAGLKDVRYQSFLCGASALHEGYK